MAPSDAYSAVRADFKLPTLLISFPTQAVNPVISSAVTTMNINARTRMAPDSSRDLMVSSRVFKVVVMMTKP
jgi:hypothetical protein